MNYKDMYFHGLAGSLDTTNNKMIIETSLNQLNSILKTGGIYSKHILELNNINYIGKPVFNGEDYISLCIKEPDDVEYTGINEGLDNAYNKYVEDRISIVIDNNINTTHIFREGIFLPGERQVKDSILSSNFKAIMIGIKNEELKNIVSDLVSNILEDNNINIPIIDNEYNILKDSTKNKII